ncbi:MAG TPA: beta-ketoacyl synthase N-terminal-like domain-containing protein [Chitinophagales bacterium]|nr:beta-ketoacyl synthase N-terminal-like domain-containing protein [Chitinophagales bacterium]
MKPVYIAADNIISPLGNSTAENFEKVRKGISGIRQVTDATFAAEPFYASMFAAGAIPVISNDATRFENLCIASIQHALSQTSITLADAGTLFILSTTKGNIELIEGQPVTDELQHKVSLYNTAKSIAGYFGSVNKPLVISNACISGVLAVVTAGRLLQQGTYRHVVITGADVLSRFVISGFKALNAMSMNECKPFDKQRDGINLGECAATIVLTVDSKLSKGVVVSGGSSTNDANHISGPSRTGLELSYAANTAMQQSEVLPAGLSFVSAHGTATVYNDEMEAKAFSHSGLSAIPVHSLKGHFGHTLGAAGVLESILTCQSLLDGVVLPSRNFGELGVSETINVSKELNKSDKNHALKTASGFGGCNAAVVYSLDDYIDKT